MDSSDWLELESSYAAEFKPGISPERNLVAAAVDLHGRVGSFPSVGETLVWVGPGGYADAANFSTSASSTFGVSSFDAAGFGRGFQAINAENPSIINGPGNLLNFNGNNLIVGTNGSLTWGNSGAAAAKAATRTSLFADIPAAEKPEIRTALGLTNTQIENRASLRDFYKALSLYNAAPTTTRVVVGYYGDSVSSHVSEAFFRRLIATTFPRAEISEPAVMQATLGYAVTGAALTYDGPTKTILSNIAYDGTDGGVNFTYLPSGQHKTLANGSIVTWDGGQESRFNEARVYFAKGPGFGSAFVELINRDTLAVITSATINCSGASLTGDKVAFTGISETVKYKIRVTATGSVVVLHTTLLRAHGLVPVSLSLGGSTLTQNNYSNAAIFTYLTGDLGISLIFCQCKEENASVGVPAAMTRLGLATSASKFVIGSLPDVGSEAVQIANNAIFRSNALSYGYAYFDGRAAFGVTGSYAELVRLGWHADGVHPNIAANDYVAALIVAELGVELINNAPIKKSINQSGTTNTVHSYTIGTFSGSNGITPIDVIVNAGGGSPTSAIVKNLRNIWFGDPAVGTVSGFGPYGSGATVSENSAGSAIAHRASYFEALSTSASAFPALRVGDATTGGFGTPLTSVRTGRATLTSGVVTITDAPAGINAKIQVSRAGLNGSTALGTYDTGTRSAGVSWTITSRKSDTTVEAGDSSIVEWLLMDN